MYLEHFGLKEPPFRITPHTDFFFQGANRGATLDALLYAITNDEGIVKVSGEVGSGKTMLCRVLMERLPATVETIYLANPSLSRDEILFAIGDELKVQIEQDRPTRVIRALQERLLRLYGEGRRVVVLIDEAHAMPEESLEEIRLLSNLESNRHKLLQIVLFGQPELDDHLDTAEMRQLKERITHSFRLEPMVRSDIESYIDFRMRAAGYRGPKVFTREAIGDIARASEGLTRRINILADKALLAAFSEGAHGVTAKQAQAAIADSEFAGQARPVRPVAAIGLAALAGAAIAGAAAYWALRPVPTPVAPPPPPALTPAPQAPAPAAPPRAQATVPAAPDAASAAPLLSKDQLARLESFRPEGHALLAGRLSASREKLRSAPDAHYTLELYVTDNSDPARLERFLARARDLVPLESVFLVPLPAGGHYRIWALYGDFPTREAAAQAARRLPPKYQRSFPLEPRSFAELRHAF